MLGERTRKFIFKPPKMSSLIKLTDCMRLIAGAMDTVPR